MNIFPKSYLALGDSVLLSTIGENLSKYSCPYIALAIQDMSSIPLLDSCSK